MYLPIQFNLANLRSDDFPEILADLLKNGWVCLPFGGPQVRGPFFLGICSVSFREAIWWGGATFRSNIVKP